MKEQLTFNHCNLTVIETFLFEGMFWALALLEDKAERDVMKRSEVFLLYFVLEKFIIQLLEGVIFR